MAATGSSEDLDWVRRQLVELDDARRVLPAADLAGRDAIHRLIDDLRSLLRSGYSDAIEGVKAQWADRAGLKGGHEVDYEAIAGMVRSMMPSQGR